MKKDKQYQTDFLFSTANFLTGAGSAFSLGGCYFDFNASSSDFIADQKALESDFGMVGHDISKSIENYSNDLEAISQ